MILSKERQLVGSGPAQNFGQAQGCRLDVFAHYTQQDIANNRSYCVADLILVVPVGYIGSYVSNNVKIFNATGISGYNTYMGSAGYTTQSLGTIEGWVYHNDNGELTMNFSGSAYFPPWGQTLTVNVSADLPTIPRVSDIYTDKTEYNIGDKIAITTAKKADIFVDKVGISFGKTINDEQFVKYLSENVVEPIIWNTTEDSQNLYKMIPNDANGICKIFVETYSGEELIGTPKEVLVKLNVVDSNPKFENFVYEDTNPKTLGLTGNKKTIVKGYSNVKATIPLAYKAIALNEATMKLYRFVIGEKQEKVDYSDTQDVSVTIEKANNNFLVMYAIDSREFSQIKQIVPDNYLEYKKPSILSFDVFRSLNGVGETVTLKINGEFWNENFGSTQNAVEIKCRYKPTDEDEWGDKYQTIIPTMDGNKYSFEGQIAGDLENAGFDLENSYDIEILVVDKLDSTPTTDTLGSGTPNLAVHKNGTAFNGIYDESVGGLLQIAGQKTAEKTDENELKVYASNSLKNGKRLLTEDDCPFEIGDLYITTNHTKPSVKWEGTSWEQIKDTFLLACGDKYGAGTTGGSEKHSHLYGIRVGGFYSNTKFAEDTDAGLLSWDEQNNTHLINTSTVLTGIATTINGGVSTSTWYSTSNYDQAVAQSSYENTFPTYLSVYVWKRTA